MQPERDHQRCYVAPAAWQGATATPDGDEWHHLVHVLRLQPGDHVALFDGAGRTGLAQLAADGAALRVLETAQQPRPAVALHLLLALPREPVMDLLLPKAVELGVAAVTVAPTARSVARLKADRLAGKTGRWRKLLVNAARQCGTAWLPELTIQPALDQLIQAVTGGPARLDYWIVGSLAGDARSLRAALAAAPARTPLRVGVLIGPEGDLTPAELAAAQAAGAVPVSFGPLTLRVDTAALCALSVLRCHYAS